MAQVAGTKMQPRQDYDALSAFHLKPSSNPRAPCAGKGLVCVVWPHKAPNFPALPQRLGAVHCVNRPCGLWHVLIPDAGIAEVQVCEWSGNPVTLACRRNQNAISVAVRLSLRWLTRYTGRCCVPNAWAAERDEPAHQPRRAAARVPVI